MMTVVWSVRDAGEDAPRALGVGGHSATHLLNSRRSTPGAASEARWNWPLYWEASIAGERECEMEGSVVEGFVE